MSVLKDGVLFLYGYVGENFWGEGFTAREVIDALAELGRDADVTVRLNSAGGYVQEGIAIHSILAQHKGRVTVQIDAIAASSGALIAMAGDDIRMLSGSLMMLHEPSGSYYDMTVDDLESAKNGLDRMASAFASIHAEKSGKPVDEVREIMRAETWFTADEAVEAGFATEAVSAKSVEVAAFDYRVCAKAPARLVALAKKKDWSLEKEIKARAAGAAQKPGQQETQMTETTPPAALTAEDVAKAKTDAVAEYKKHRAAVLALPEAKGREALAEALIDAGLSVDQIKASLAAAPTPKGGEPVEDDPGERQDPEAYERQRAAAAGLAAPTGKAKPQNSWARHVADANSRFQS